MEAGQVLAWRIRAVDAWGAGAETAPPDVALEALPEAPEREADPEPEESTGGCSSVPAPLGLPAMLVALVGLGRRRR